MLAEHKLKAFQELVTQSSREELIWMNGFLAGLVSAENGVGAAGAGVTAVAQPAAPKVNKISILFGTETGNSKKVATEFAAQAKKQGVNVKLTSLDQYRVNDLAKEEYTFLVISTQGDGEPPATAKKFYDHIHQQNIALDKMKFSVLALGDTSYPLFCKAGEDVDTQLAKLGAKRVAPLQKCDTDYATDAAAWFANVMKVLSDQGGNTVTTSSAVAKPKGKKNYTGTIITNLNLNDRGSGKQTHHIEIGVEDEVHYEPGDSIGLIPHNKKETVDTIIALTGADADTVIEFRKERYTIAEALTRKINIIHLPERVVKQYASVIQQEIPDTRIDLLDLLRIYPVKDAGQFEQVLQVMEPIAPRLYSISSSPEAHSGEVHITVARDKFIINGEEKYGFCSDFLTHLDVDSNIDFYVHKNNQFKLPAADKDVIMIGPGTGIAPFRSFIAQRDAVGASGRNWLFFGDQKFTTDFLYQTEIQNWVDTSVLTRVNLAFSRDQKSKIYVQHKMLEQADELWQWIDNGAYIYICGAKAPMSTDVENTLLQIIERYSGKSIGEAIAYFDKMKEEGRYLLDVY
ncbi:sulfite reductase [Terrimonas sp.]|uniref:diflavin oxidoreductase n=1 Tax=Terrimonas sp. TaxID=1914338 RepID=UPI000D51C8FA|nr:flavodoxin domain-containing protein [Terrimonas sp.]PVD53873.1 sulfite reductase [Terrimonas sp.]